MGYYIQTENILVGKAAYLVNKYNAKVLPKAPEWNDIPEDQAIICVVNNGLFEACGYCYNSQELNAFNRPTDFRDKIWLLIDKELTNKLTKYTSGTKLL